MHGARVECHAPWCITPFDACCARHGLGSGVCRLWCARPHEFVVNHVKCTFLAGGTVGLLALNALFVLMTEYNLYVSHPVSFIR